jgi:hypothetical protein
MFKAEWIKPKLQWRPWDVGNTRNMECVWREASGNKWRQCMKETM